MKPSIHLMIWLISITFGAWAASNVHNQEAKGDFNSDFYFVNNLLVFPAVYVASTESVIIYRLAVRNTDIEELIINSCTRQKELNKKSGG